MTHVVNEINILDLILRARKAVTFMLESSPSVPSAWPKAWMCNEVFTYVGAHVSQEPGVIL